MTDRALCWSYAVYVIAFEMLALGGSAFVVFGLGRSPWWMLLGVAISAAAIPPNVWRRLLSDEDDQ